ncbi:MAG: hypothetical protein QXS41_03835, partial [Candidatus Woesearchaeota archaeon]
PINFTILVNGTDWIENSNLTNFIDRKITIFNGGHTINEVDEVNSFRIESIDSTKENSNINVNVNIVSPLELARTELHYAVSDLLIDGSCSGMYSSWIKSSSNTQLSVGGFSNKCIKLRYFAEDIAGNIVFKEDKNLIIIKEEETLGLIINQNVIGTIRFSPINMIPIIKEIRLTSTFIVKQEVNFSAIVEDSDDDLLSYNWTLLKNNAIIYSSNKEKDTYVPQETGQYLLNLTINDSKDEVSSIKSFNIMDYNYCSEVDDCMIVSCDCNSVEAVNKNYVNTWYNERGCNKISCDFNDYVLLCNNNICQMDRNNEFEPPVSPPTPPFDPRI